MTRWTFPLHARFNEILHRATCVPILRLPFQNYGVRELGWAESVVERQTVRDKVDPNFHTYGKVCSTFFAAVARAGADWSDWADLPPFRAASQTCFLDGSSCVPPSFLLLNH